MNVQKPISIMFLAILCIVLPGCFPTDDTPLGTTVQGSTTSEKRTGLVVVNVLDKELYDDCHIAGSINIPFEQLDECIDSIDKDAQIVFYCTNYLCSTSEYAAQKLKQAGFEHVAVYEGGTAEWYQKGLPVEGPGKSRYLNVKMNPQPCETQVCKIITADELAQKMGIEISE